MLPSLTIICLHYIRREIGIELPTYELIQQYIYETRPDELYWLSSYYPLTENERIVKLFFSAIGRSNEADEWLLLQRRMKDDVGGLLMNVCGSDSLTFYRVIADEIEDTHYYQNNRLEIAKWLTDTLQLTISDIRANKYCLEMACQNGHLEIVKWLITYFQLTIDDIRAEGNYCIKIACQNGHLEVVRLIITYFQLTADDIRAAGNYCLRISCQNGHLEVARLLIT